MYVPCSPSRVYLRLLSSPTMTENLDCAPEREMRPMFCIGSSEVFESSSGLNPGNMCETCLLSKRTLVAAGEYVS